MGSTTLSSLSLVLLAAELVSATIGSLSAAVAAAVSSDFNFFTALTQQTFRPKIPLEIGLCKEPRKCKTVK
jgi:hypothetical protein